MLAMLLATLIGQTTTKTEAPKPKPTLVAIEGHTPRVGDVLTIYCREGGKLTTCPVANTLEAWRELQACVAAKDKVGVQKMLEAGTAFIIDSGTELRILEVGLGGQTQKLVGRVPARKDGSGGLVDVFEYGQEPQFRWFAARISSGTTMRDHVIYIDNAFVKKCELVYPKAKKKKK